MLSPITCYGKAALNLIWQIDNNLQEQIKQQNPTLSKSQIKKHSLGWGDDLRKVVFPTDELKKKFEGVKLVLLKKKK